jgi:quercetin dioxygenase-like cupin family protein
MSAAEATTVVDNEQVRVTTWTFGADGDTTGWHLHENDYIVVPVTGGTFAVTAPDGGTHELTPARRLALPRQCRNRARRRQRQRSTRSLR